MDREEAAAYIVCMTDEELETFACVMSELAVGVGETIDPDKMAQGYKRLRDSLREDR